MITSGQSYGLLLQNLIYKRQDKLKLYPLSSRQKTGYIMTRVLLFWAYPRLQRIMTVWSNEEESTTKSRLYSLFQFLEISIRASSLINFFIFLYNGRFRSLMDRVLGISLVFEQTEMSRMISFEFMNRQLVWQTFTEFFVTVIPLLNFSKIKRRIKSKMAVSV